jgi:hypothetical protein
MVLIVCRNSGSHSGDYEQFYLVEYNAMKFGKTEPTFRTLSSQFAELQVLTALIMSSCIFWDTMPYNPVTFNRRFAHVPAKYVLTVMGYTPLWPATLHLTAKVNITNSGNVAQDASGPFKPF